MPTLFVECKKCGTEFTTPMGETNPGSSGVIITGLRLRCQKCGTEDDYSTADFHVPKSVPGSAPGSGDKAEEDLTTERNAKQEAAQEKFAGFGIVPPEGRSPRDS